MGICQPRKDRAFIPILFKNKAIKPDEACSPDDKIVSISLASPLISILLIKDCK